MMLSQTMQTHVFLSQILFLVSDLGCVESRGVRLRLRCLLVLVTQLVLR